mmetsp:Transcript_31259/g.57227  ORF Transcript_31259/g.57227 Transcript_31259/m.57227 type:complete len:212 (-) Transcript_31259:493-1128(-)
MALTSSIWKNSHTVARKKQMIPKRGSARTTASTTPPMLSCNWTLTNTTITAKTSTNVYFDSHDSHNSAEVRRSTVMGKYQTINTKIFFAYGHTPDNKTITQASNFAPLFQLSFTVLINVISYALYQVSIASRSKLLQLFLVAGLGGSAEAFCRIVTFPTSDKPLQARNLSTHGARHPQHSALAKSAMHVNAQPLLTPHGRTAPKQTTHSSE